MTEVAKTLRKTYGPDRARGFKKRSCGDCNECCTVKGISSMDSPAYEPCKHVCEKGCTVYLNRPDECREYYCAWRLGFFEEKHRPDRCGVLGGFQDGEHKGIWLQSCRREGDVSDIALDLVQIIKTQAYNDMVYYSPWGSRDGKLVYRGKGSPA